MPRPIASPDQATSNYTRVSGTGEAANRPGHAPAVGLDAVQSTPTQEIAMFRTFTTAALLALTITTAQAQTSDQVAARIHDAAVTACAPERATGALPRSHYGEIDDHCVYRTSRAAMDKYEAQAKAAQNSMVA